MTSAEVFRPVQNNSMTRPGLVLGMAFVLAGCGWVEHDPHRFERLAQRVADIPVSLERPGVNPGVNMAKTANEAGTPALRPVFKPATTSSGGKPGEVRVQVLETHDFWEARDGALEGLVRVAAPVVAEAAVAAIEQRVVEGVPALRPRPVSVRADAPVRQGAHMVQLGAFGSEAAARTAWTRLSAQAPDIIGALVPVFEPVRVDGRNLVRLRVSVPTASVDAVCAAARVRDAWCRRAG